MFAMIRNYQKAIIYALMALFCVLWAYPIVRAVTKSFEVSGLQNYANVWNHTKVDVPKSILNSFIIAISVSLVTVVVISLAGYAFSKMQFRLRGVLYYTFLMCLTIPTVSIITPLFTVSKQLGLMNSNLAIILPLLFLQAPFGLLIFKNFVDSIPDALLEAAEIDGASKPRVYWSIILPLTRIAVINVGIISFINAWNEYLVPLILISKVENYTVTLATTYFSGGIHQTPEMVAQLYAALVLMCIPTMLIYIFCQRYLQEGLTAGAVKG